MKNSDASKTTKPAATAVKRAIASVPEKVRMEASLDALPIWAPSSAAQETERTYMTPWRGEGAGAAVQSSGKYGMLRWFDKLTLAAVVQLWNDQGQDPSGKGYFKISDIIALLGKADSGESYDQIDQSLHRLLGCLIQFYGSLYSMEDGMLVTPELAKTIFSKGLFLRPHKKTKFGNQRTLDGLTYAQIDLDICQNLLGNYTRPVPLQLLCSLSERGILYESYVNSVLYRRSRIVKDVFTLWDDLGLSYKGIEYGSQLASRMRKDLDKIAADPNTLLGSYSFEKSKGRAKGQNLILVRKRNAKLDVPPQHSSQLTGRTLDGVPADPEKLVGSSWRFRIKARMTRISETSNRRSPRVSFARQPTRPTAGTGMD